MSNWIGVKLFLPGGNRIRDRRMSNRIVVKLHLADGGKDFRLLQRTHLDSFFPKLALHHGLYRPRAWASAHAWAEAWG